MVGWGLAVDQKKSAGEINAPFIYAEQIHATQLYLSYREAIRKSAGPRAENIKILKDRSTASDLAMAPFKGENLSSPWALGFAALGVGLNYLGARLDKADRDFWDVREARIQGDAFRPRTALGVYGAFWVPISLGAAVSEESIFRGMIQTGWEDRWGKTRGLVATSALFGIAHYDGSGPAAGDAALAVLAGM